MHWLRNNTEKPFLESLVVISCPLHGNQVWKIYVNSDKAFSTTPRNFVPTASSLFGVNKITDLLLGWLSGKGNEACPSTEFYFHINCHLPSPLQGAQIRSVRTAPLGCIAAVSATLKISYYILSILSGLSKGSWIHATKYSITHTPVKKEFLWRCQTGQDKTDPPTLYNIKALSTKQKLGTWGLAAGIVATPIYSSGTGRVQCSCITKVQSLDSKRCYNFCMKTGKAISATILS